MSGFTDQLALDVSSTFLDSEVFGQSGSYQCTDGGAPFAISVVVGDAVMSELQVDFGVEARRVATLFCQRSTIFVGITTALGTGRDSKRGDSITIATGPDAGTWIIQGPPQEDFGDGANLTAVLPLVAAPGARGARELR